MQGLVTQSVIGLVASVSLDSGGMCGSRLWFSKNCGGVPIPTEVLKLPSPPGSLTTAPEMAPLVLTGSALSPLAKMVLLILSACSERAGRDMAHWHLGRSVNQRTVNNR